MDEIIALQERIEDEADSIDVSVMWMDTPKYPVVSLYGGIIGEFHMTALLHRRAFREGETN